MVYIVSVGVVVLFALTVQVIDLTWRVRALERKEAGRRYVVCGQEEVRP